ncbi:hypothetical protein V6N11_008756 [Hibiscus sabdariffa]|uniref:Uncharacterized protein n=1 Tax=Hibiscus sabdariffa TaxID=183260 RepID=A0ABR2NQJ8_9ROSI
MYENLQLEAQLAASQEENAMMKEQVKDLECSLQTWQEELESFKELQEYEKARWEAQLQHSQDQVRNHDHIMSEALVQVKEVAEHLQTLAVQADVISVQTELESTQGKRLTSLLREIKLLAILGHTDKQKQHPYFTRSKSKKMAEIVEEVEKIRKEIKKEMKDLLDKSQTDLLSKIAAMLSGRDPERGKGVVINSDVMINEPGSTQDGTPCTNEQSFQANPSNKLVAHEGLNECIVPDLNEIEKLRVEIPKQFEDLYK